MALLHDKRLHKGFACKFLVLQLYVDVFLAHQVQYCKRSYSTVPNVTTEPVIGPTQSFGCMCGLTLVLVG